MYKYRHRIHHERKLARKISINVFITLLNRKKFDFWY